MSGRRLGLALALGAALAMAADVVLQLSLRSVRIGPAVSRVPAAILSKSVWLTVAMIAAAVVPHLTPFARTPLEWPGAFRLAGTILIVAPVGWFIATLLVFAGRVTLTGAWTTDGQIFLQPLFYSEIVTTNGPWVLSGAALRLISRHLRAK